MELSIDVAENTTAASKPCPPIPRQYPACILGRGSQRLKIVVTQPELSARRSRDETRAKKKTALIAEGRFNTGSSGGPPASRTRHQRIMRAFITSSIHRFTPQNQSLTFPQAVNRHQSSSMFRTIYGHDFCNEDTRATYSRATKFSTRNSFRL